MNALNILLEFFLRILPGLIVGITFILLFGKKHLAIRIFSYILLFIAMRDVFAPLNVWKVGETEGVFWLRMIEDPVFLILGSLLCIFLAVLLNKLDKEARQLCVYIKKSLIHALSTGLIGAVISLIPMLLIYQFVPIENRGGEVTNSPVFLCLLLVFCLCVNFLEESIYRGYVQGYAERYFTPTKSAILSGILFSFSHMFLAITVTNAGWGILAFTAYVGIIAGLVRSKAGVIASTITHGVAIFFLVSDINFFK